MSGGRSGWPVLEYVVFLEAGWDLIVILLQALNREEGPF